MCRSYVKQAGPFHPKHGGGLSIQNHATILPPLHPCLAFVIHYSVAITNIFVVHDLFFDYKSIGSEKVHLSDRQDQIGTFLLVYAIILFGARYSSSFLAGRLRQHAVLYELTWLCNSTLVIGCISFGGLGNLLNVISEDILTKYQILRWICRRRPLAVTACCVGVSIDQVLWYVDLLGRTFSGKFPIGVAKYLTWKQTLWVDRLTCTHHLWTFPLVIYGAGEMSFSSYLLSIYVVAIQVLLSRWLTPHHIQTVEESIADIRSDPSKYRYLNVNLSHELWRDISFSFLQISKDNPPCCFYLFRLLWRWQLLNLVVFVGVLLPLDRLMN
jgi:hypothetical protein